MKTIIQKAIYKVIQKRVVRYNCDYCGLLLNKDNHKQTYYQAGENKGTKHVCKYKQECNPFYKTPKGIKT